MSGSPMVAPNVPPIIADMIGKIDDPNVSDHVKANVRMNLDAIQLAIEAAIKRFDASQALQRQFPTKKSARKAR